MVGIIRWVLPLGLAAIALFAEISEHVVREHEPTSPSFIGEIVLFAVIGPIAVFATLTWVARLLRDYETTSAELAVVNADLEAIVLERTRHLEEATGQLAEANAELAEANEDLRKLDTLKSEFVSLVSHQLRAPLTNIRGALEIVQADAGALPPGSRRTLDILAVESDRLSSLILTILDVSRVEAGRLVPRMGPVATEPLVMRACETTLGDGTGSGRPWEVAAAQGLPPAWADEQLLDEVVRNLLGNADRYSPPGAPVAVRLEPSSSTVSIVIADHGPGIPAEEQELVFRSFHRVGDSDTTVDGYGLGLYFADKLVRAMGGTIALESPAWPESDDPGTRFVVTLPIAADGPTNLDSLDEL
jgi:signal transduction histidine kinase